MSKLCEAVNVIMISIHFLFLLGVLNRSLKKALARDNLLRTHGYQDITVLPPPSPLEPPPRKLKLHLFLDEMRRLKVSE